MAVYSKDGTALNAVYDVNGNRLAQAYDIDGAPLLPTEPVSLRVATYNVGGWYIGSGTNVPTTKKAQYVNLQQDILAQVNADLVCFQEYWRVFCADGTTAQTVIGSFFTQIETTNATTQYSGHAIGAKGIELEDYQVIPFVHPVAAQPSYDKCYITVGDRRICIINSHLSTAAGGQKEPQSQELFDAVQNEPYFMIFGDWNTEATDYASIVEKFVNAGYHSANLNGTGNWLATYYTSGGVGKPTDQIITSANITLDAVSVNTLKLTDGLSDNIDHIPLIAEVTIL